MRSWNASSEWRWPMLDDGGLGQPFGQAAIEFRLLVLVMGSGNLVEKQPVGFQQQGARDHDALLLAGGEALRPMRALVEPSPHMAEPDETERLDGFVVALAPRLLREPDRVAQRADRHIGPLRQEQRLRISRQQDFAAGIRPQPGQHAEQRALAAARGTAEHHRLMRLELQVRRCVRSEPSGSQIFTSRNSAP